MDDWMIRYQKERSEQLEQSRQKRKDLVPRLLALGVVEVIFTFDGCGDDGQINDVTAKNAEGVSLDAGEVIPSAMSAVLFDIANVTLDSKHEGWEINAGAFGTMTWNVSEDKVSMEFNARVEDVETTNYTDL